MALTIRTSALEDGLVGKPYCQILGAQGGSGALTWSVTPTLPQGLTLDGKIGIIQGTPAVILRRTAYTFTVTDTSDTATRVLALEIKDVLMSAWAVRWLAAYLLVSACLTGCLIYTLWSSRPIIDRARLPDCGGSDKPTLNGVYPARVDVGSASSLLLQGCRFTQKTQVKLNGMQRNTSFVDPDHIRVVPNAGDVTSPGPLLIALFSEDGTQFGSTTLWVTQPEFYWKIFGLGPWDISLEMQLLLLVLCAGAFGSSVYSVKSLADYLGDARLYRSWSLYYFIQPVEGAGVAFLFYVAIRGGFLAGTGSDVKAVNQFGICTIAGLAGAFSDMAFLKLREVFQTLFKPRDDRGGKVSGLKTVTTALPDGMVGQTYNQILQATGGTGTTTWSVAPALPAGLKLDVASGTISGIPASALPTTNFKFTVTDSDTPPASATVTLSLQIK